MGPLSKIKIRSEINDVKKITNGREKKTKNRSRNLLKLG
jgi:hypothetical protein